MKLWDIKEESCLQTEVLKFPPFKVLGKFIEWGVNSIYPGPKRQEVLNDVKQSCNEYAFFCLRMS